MEYKIDRTVKETGLRPFHCFDITKLLLCNKTERKFKKNDTY